MTIRSLRGAALVLGLALLLGACGDEVQEASEPAIEETPSAEAVTPDSLLDSIFTVDTQAIPGDTALADITAADTAGEMR